jgi:hypothetical protein
MPNRSNNSMTGGGGSLYSPAASDERITGIFLLLPLFDKQLQYRLSV